MGYLKLMRRDRCASRGGQVRDWKKWGPEVKTMYRSHAVHAVNQHRYRQMYPLPMHISEPAGKKKNERYGWFHQKSNEPDVWPKLFHYRVGLARMCVILRGEMLMRVVIVAWQSGWRRMPDGIANEGQACVSDLCRTAGPHGEGSDGEALLSERCMRDAFRSGRSSRSTGSINCTICVSSK